MGDRGPSPELTALGSFSVFASERIHCYLDQTVAIFEALVVMNDPNDPAHFDAETKMPNDRAAAGSGSASREETLGTIRSLIDELLQSQKKSRSRWTEIC